MVRLEEFLMRLPMHGTFVAAFLSFLSLVPAQVASPPSLLATEQYLFVVRGDTLYQFDLHTLVLRNSFAFPAAAMPVAAPVGTAKPVTATAGSAPPAAAAAPAAGGSAMAVSLGELVVTEPLPPPAPAAAVDWQGSVDRALQWLVAHQDGDGKWDCDGFMRHDRDGEPCGGPGNAVHDVGVTALAVLAMLGDGSNLRNGRYQAPVKKAVVWLKSQQQENGLFGVNASHDFIYDHAIATYAVCEAYGLSNYKLLQPIAQKGLDYLESHRNPYAVWRYQPRDGDNDTSVTTWAVSALQSGKFFGLNVNEQTSRAALAWYDQVTTPDGRVGYTKAGETSSRMPGDHGSRFPVQNVETMTAAAMFGRFMLGQQVDGAPMLGAGAELLLQRLPRWEPGHIDAVYWYFGTYAMLQHGGPHWQAWQQAMQQLPAHQCTEGCAAGSWDPVGVWDESGGRVFVTALYTLTLESAARLSRLVR